MPKKITKKWPFAFLTHDHRTEISGFNAPFWDTFSVLNGNDHSPFPTTMDKMRLTKQEEYWGVLDVIPIALLLSLLKNFLEKSAEQNAPLWIIVVPIWLIWFIAEIVHSLMALILTIILTIIPAIPLINWINKNPTLIKRYRSVIESEHKVYTITGNGYRANDFPQSWEDNISNIREGNNENNPVKNNILENWGNRQNLSDKIPHDYSTFKNNFSSILNGLLLNINHSTMRFKFLENKNDSNDSTYSDTCLEFSYTTYEESHPLASKQTLIRKGLVIIPLKAKEIQGLYDDDQKQSVLEENDYNLLRDIKAFNIINFNGKLRDMPADEKLALNTLLCDSEQHYGR